MELIVTTGQRLIHDWLVLFAMVNAVGNLPIFAELTSGMPADERRQAFRTAVMTGAGIVLGFAVLGDWMLKSVFQVDVSAFKVAGGVLVFAVAARGMLQGPRLSAPALPGQPDTVAVFPMGFPFLAGPGTIVTTILLMQTDGRLLASAAAVAVYAVVLLVLRLAPFIQKATGRIGVLVIPRILYIFIAAKAVAFILDGLTSALGLRR